MSVISIAPEEESLIGLRPVAELFGNNVSRIRAPIKLAWRFSIFMEIAASLRNHYKLTSLFNENKTFTDRLQKWSGSGTSFLPRLRTILKEAAKLADDPESRIGELADFLNIANVAAFVAKCLAKSGRRYAILVDRLDEGYEPL